MRTYLRRAVLAIGVVVSSTALVLPSTPGVAATIDHQPWDLHNHGDGTFPDAAVLTDTGPNCSETSVGFVPLIDGEGLYENGNTMPAAHAGAAPAIAPIGGVVGVVSLGMSNAFREWGTFMDTVAGMDSVSSSVKFANGAVGGKTMNEWADPTDIAWEVSLDRIVADGLAASEVQVVWMKMGSQLGQLNGSLSERIAAERGWLTEVIANAKAVFPNLKRVYISSRIYVGYNSVPNHNEPETGFDNGLSVKTVVADSIVGDLAVWTAWGPYLWADGTTLRSDGLTWECADFVSDGVHPSTSGKQKVADLLVSFLSTNDTTCGWFLADTSGCGTLLQYPTASFTSALGATPFQFDFDASASNDDGTIVSYDWDFGDSTQETGVTATHAYLAAGPYVVSLQVTDDDGLTATTTQVVTVTDGTNQAPAAMFSASTNGLGVTFTDESTDVDGSVVTWAWDFGDGQTSGSQNPSHDYTSPGTYTVTLSVTDDAGASDSLSIPVTVSQGGGATALHIGDLDGTAADDDRGRWQATVTITVHDDNDDPVVGATVSGDWIVGTTGSGSCVTDVTATCTITQGRIKATSAAVTFAAAGVLLDPLTYDPATNHDPDADSDGTQIVISYGANGEPTAGFTWSCSEMTCGFTDMSSDADGSVASWLWDFGHTGTSTLQSPSHFYGADGVYTVTLTVTDNEGATNSTSAPVTVGPPGGGASIHIADLDGVAVSQGVSDWLAIVTAAVVDENAVPVEGATVTVQWRTGDVMSCTSAADGLCGVELLTSRTRTSMTVTSVAHATMTYDPGSNGDPDGDSDGTVIIVVGP